MASNVNIVEGSYRVGISSPRKSLADLLPALLRSLLCPTRSLLVASALDWGRWGRVGRLRRSTHACNAGTIKHLVASMAGSRAASARRRDASVPPQKLLYPRYISLVPCDGQWRISLLLIFLPGWTRCSLEVARLD